MTTQELAEIEAYLEEKGVITPQARRHVLPLARAQVRVQAERREHEASVDAAPPREETLMRGVWYEDIRKKPA